MALGAWMLRFAPAASDARRCGCFAREAKYTLVTTVDEDAGDS